MSLSLLIEIFMTAQINRVIENYAQFVKLYDWILDESMAVCSCHICPHKTVHFFWQYNHLQWNYNCMLCMCDIKKNHVLCRSFIKEEAFLVQDECDWKDEIEYKKQITEATPISEQPIKKIKGILF